eukprot:2162320-Prymnesium_polylepis.1
MTRCLVALRTLGLDACATATDIKAAYRRLAKQHHPDALGALGASDQAVRAASEMRFKEVANAYERLTQPQRALQQPRRSRAAA